MTDVARDAVTSERAVLSVRVVGQRIDHVVFERPMTIEFQLTLAHHPVPATTWSRVSPGNRFTACSETSGRPLKKFTKFRSGDFLAVPNGPPIIFFVLATC